MATVADIKKAILEVAGNPESGPIASLADEMARAVAALDEEKVAKETRVVKPTETR